MRNFIYLVVFSLFSCHSPSSKIIEDFKKVDNTLDKSNQSIENANRLLSDALINGSGFIKIKNTASELISYIEAVKEKIKQVSGNVDSNDGMTNLTTSNKILLDQKKADTIFAALKNFQQLVLLKCDDNSVKAIVNNNFYFLNDNEKNNKSFFKNMPTVTALTMLSKYQNDIKSTENLILFNYSINKK